MESTAINNQDGLISKKELLQKYGISYGALYRWKRKGLIPEDWFIKKSTSTGQETFFPEKLICQRVELIQAQKEDTLLDDLARQLKGEKPEPALIVATEFGEKTFVLRDVKAVYVLDEQGQKRDITKLVLGG